MLEAAPALIGLAVIALLTLLWRKRVQTPSIESFLLPEAPKNTVILHQFGPAPHVPSVSPFVIKLETYLRVTGIPYINKFDRRLGPKGKIPWIQYNNDVMADSQACIEFLNGQFDVDLNKTLTNQQLAIGHVIRRTAEEFLYWTMVMWRLTFDPEMTLYRSLGLPRPFLWYLRRVSSGRVSAQGIGCHSQSEVTKLMDDDLRAIDTLMGGRQFLFSDDPEGVTEFDCALFGQLCQLIWQCPGTCTKQHIEEEFPNLVKYCERMKSAYWPDWDTRLKTTPTSPRPTVKSTGTGSAMATNPNGKTPSGDTSGAENESAVTSVEKNHVIEYNGRSNGTLLESHTPKVVL